MPFYPDASGRQFTDYRVRCNQDEEIKKKYKLNDNYSYKLFIQRNGNLIIQDQRSLKFGKN